MKKLVSVSVIAALLALYPNAAQAAANTYSTDLEDSSSMYWRDTSTSGVSGSSDFTVDTLFKLEQLPSTAGSDHFGVMTVGTSGGSNSVALRLLTNNQFYCTFDSGSALSQFRTNAIGSSFVGAWHQITCAVDVSVPSAQFYLDGVATTTTTVESGATSRRTTSEMYVGSDTYGAGRYWDGLLDETAFYTTQLGSAPDPCTRTASDSGLVAWYKFDNDATDETSNANDLTGVNSPTFTTDVNSSCSAGSTPAPDDGLMLFE